MIFISEVFPNPAGKDTDGEWIELYNSGNTLVSLAGYGIRDASGKKFLFTHDVIPSQGFLTLPYSRTKISLNNSSETLTLFSGDTIIDTFSYTAAVGDDISVARTDTIGVIAYTSKATPGTYNVIIAPVTQRKNSRTDFSSYYTASSVRDDSIPSSIPSSQTLVEGSSLTSVVGIGIFVSIVSAGVFWWAFCIYKRL